MPRIQVFAIDWVPGQNDIASGGGLRSRQIVEALRSSDHQVSVAVPRNSRAVQAIMLSEPLRMNDIDVYHEDDQIDLIRRVKPDIVLWLWPTVRRTPFTGLGDIAHICDLNGLQDYELANGSVSRLRSVREVVIRSCQGADIVLTGSPEQHGYWIAHLGEGRRTPEAVLAGYALPPSMLGEVICTRSRLKNLHFVGNVYSWSASTMLLKRAAQWLSKRDDIRMQIIGGTDPGGATPIDDLRALHDLETSPRVDLRAEATFAEAMASFAPGSLALDLNVPTVERKLAVPIRTVNALLHGVPILTTVDSPFMRRLERAGAALIVPVNDPGGLEATLDRAAALSAQEFTAMSAAARAFSEREFDFSTTAWAIGGAIEQALASRKTQLKRWSVPRGSEPTLGHVLVISDETPNLRDLRVDLPFGVLYRRRLITGYSIFSRGRIVFSTAKDSQDVRFDAVWVQRSVAPEIALLLDGMDVPFVYDIDDNLLVSPSYRSAFSPENMQAGRSFIRRAAVLCCSTARLAPILQRYSAAPVLQKVIVAQNILRAAPATPPYGEPSCVVWASSDVPALTAGRLDVLRAVRDFCLTHRLRLICVGASPPELLVESDIEVEHVEMMPYSNYMELLRSLAPAIMICPLETTSDAPTQDFVNGKSDIKMLEALATGLIGVFSAARPYIDSDLPRPILCENNYRSWFEGLNKARRECAKARIAPVVPAWRLAADQGTKPYYDAVSAAQLSRPMKLSELSDRLGLIRSRLAPRRSTAEKFNEAFYLSKYPDVRDAIERNIIGSAYDHYIKFGQAENRAVCKDDLVGNQYGQWWANLMGTVSDLGISVANRQVQIEELKTRRQTRIRLRAEVTSRRDV